MAYDATKLRLIRDLGDVHYWHYLTADATGVVDSSGYFDDASGQMNVGDIILRVTVDDADAPTSVSSAGHHIVLSISAAGVVDVSDTTAIATTDTD